MQAKEKMSREQIVKKVLKNKGKRPGGRKRRSVIDLTPSKMWEKCIIPYTFDAQFDNNSYSERK